MAAVRCVVLVVAMCAALAMGDQCKMENSYPPPSSDIIAWEDINLDDPAETRWSSVVVPRAALIESMIDSVLALLPPDLQKDVLNYTDSDVEGWINALPAYGDELRGIAKATGVDLGKVFLFNIAYELEGGCTSIVAQDSKGQIYHGRNLDFGLFLGWDKVNHTWQLTEKLRPLLFNARVWRGGKVLFNATYYAGFVGLLTGMKTGGFSITVDTRYDNSLWAGLRAWLRGDHSGNFLTITTRLVMENNATYSDALLALNNTKMVGPAYIILGGAKPGEGAVITRQEALSLNLWTLDMSLKNNSFYVLETNYDHWVEPPFFDDRVHPAEDCLKRVGSSGLSVRTLYNVLAGKPNRNMLTTYTTLMSVPTGQFEAYRTYCPEPCAPW